MHDRCAAGALEAEGLINGIREFRPPHYHVAVFPRPYAEYAAARAGPGYGAVALAAIAFVVGVVLLVWLRARDPARPGG